MLERALAKRKKTVEELLQWHRKLLEEENTIISEIPSDIKKLQNENIPEQPSISSISQLIEDLNEIEQNILNLMPRESKKDIVTSESSNSVISERKNINENSLGSEAKELYRKQLAIEQEIKLLKEQQQKSFYVRNIPNKPPPPYRASTSKTLVKNASVIPSSKEEIVQITEYSAKILYKAYLTNNLDNVNISDNTLNLIGKNINKGVYKYVFDLCKEIAKDHCEQFTQAGPSWMNVDKKSKPLDVNCLQRLMSKKLLCIFGFEKHYQDNKIKKKRSNNLEDILRQEVRTEEATWTNFEKDEALIKDKVTNELMEMLLKESALVLKNVVQKKKEKQ